ncbi:MAG: exodeoxyribonuclease VII large subunit, partial [Deltaproteobacteria bacterium]|nr:exodeoxyribonuclease VII large subunit [Deltaproteobacteria bacterium]
SIEDLWCFNDENLARAISSSQIPVVSAVGHEIDFTISDFVSDVRAPTPSAAAEIITTYWVDAAKRMFEYQSNMQKSILRSVEFKKTLLSHISARVISPKDKLREQAQRADELYLKLCQAMQIKIERRKNSFYQLISKMEALSPLKVLERGFTLVKDAKEQLIRSANDIKTGMELKVIFYDGQRRVKAL